LEENLSWMRFEVLTLVKIMIIVFWVMTHKFVSEFNVINSPYNIYEMRTSALKVFEHS
jgi:hypothetical protein